MVEPQLSSMLARKVNLLNDQIEPGRFKIMWGRWNNSDNGNLVEKYLVHYFLGGMKSLHLFGTGCPPMADRIGKEVWSLFVFITLFIAGYIRCIL